MFDISSLTWPGSRLGEALGALARRSGLAPRELTPPVFPSGMDPEDVARWIVSAADFLGVESKPVTCFYPEVKRLLRASGPSLIRVPGEAEPRFLLVLKGSSRNVDILGPDQLIHREPIDPVARVLVEPLEAPAVREVEPLLDEAGLTGRRRARARSTMVSERLSQARIGDCWLLRVPPGARFWSQILKERLPRTLFVFAGSHLAQYSLWVFSWWVLGRGALEGRLDWGWLLAWALVLLSQIPFRFLTYWNHGLFAVGLGGLLKQRLLQGALRLEPDEIRHQGAGHHLGRVIESEAVEKMALSGGFLTLVACIELAVGTVVLSQGAGGVRHALLLLAWLGLTAFTAYRYLVRRRGWAQLRLGISHELIELMVGHRTRLAQQSPDRWHDEEDQALVRYLDSSRAMDRNGALLFVLPRGWLAVGLLGLAPSFVSGEASVARLAVGLGGTILACRSLQRLVGGFSFLTDAFVAWKQVAPLFHAAAREDPPGDPELSLQSMTATLSADSPRDGAPVLEGADLVFRYPDRSDPVLQKCSFHVRAGDRVLLQSPSGGGKSTLVSLLTGLRSPEAGLLLSHGLDRRSLGSDGWSRKIASAPQFHENHVITESFAFNVLMGRRWPPGSGDLKEAEAVCRELGLGDLLDRMPGGMLQMVGETGWQLSHGERSRLFIARALLQGAEVVVLDESLSALDPESLRLALGCTLHRAPTLLLIAHP